MNLIGPISVFAMVLATGVAMPSFAEDKPAEAVKPADTQAAKMAACKEQQKKRHNHAAEKGMSGGMSSKCTEADTAAATKKPMHDHAKFHKDQ